MARRDVNIDGSMGPATNDGAGPDHVVVNRITGSGRANGPREPCVRAVVLAGGRGTRLAPFTSVLPKPLMPIGDRSIVEIVIEQLANRGIMDVTLCVGHLSHLIEAVLGDGASHDVNITYVREEQELGTAAPLRLVEGLDDTFIAMNGDVLTTLDYGDLVRHHRETGSILTIATRERPIKIDYGILHFKNGDGNRVHRYVEKPEMTSAVSMGVYVLEPEALEFIPGEGRFDFPDLVKSLLRAGQQVEAYRYDGLWFDIGRRDDYEKAVAAWVAASMVNADDGHSSSEIVGAVQS